jgi:hypothetical protein
MYADGEVNVAGAFSISPKASQGPTRKVRHPPRQREARTSGLLPTIYKLRGIYIDYGVQDKFTHLFHWGRRRYQTSCPKPAFHT